MELLEPADCMFGGGSVERHNQRLIEIRLAMAAMEPIAYEMPRTRVC